MISNCGHDENGKYSGGAAGDQTGTEWEIRTWYNRPWNCVLRHPDRNVGNMLADLARKAAQNNLVGYDQNQRGYLLAASESIQLRSGADHPQVRGRLLQRCGCQCQGSWIQAGYQVSAECLCRLLYRQPASGSESSRL